MRIILRSIVFVFMKIIYFIFERILKKYENVEYIKNLENANTSLKRKLKNYEEIIQAFQSENSNNNSKNKRSSQIMK